MPKTVLIVEDNWLNRRLFADVLTDSGYRVMEAADGAEAIERARSDRPDLILMDLDLPRLPGLEAVRLLREEPGCAAIPVVAVSAFASRDDARAALASGCVGHLPKPVRPETLSAAVAERIGPGDRLATEG